MPPDQPSDSDQPPSSPTDSQPEVAVEDLQPKHKSNAFGRFFADSKKRPVVFILLFSFIGVALLLRSFAATPEGELYTAFRNFSHNKPTSVTGNASVTYNASPNLQSISADYTVKLNQLGGNSSANGNLTINNTAFPFEFRYIDKTTYLKLSNTPALSSVIPKSSQLHSYFSPRYDALNAINGQWIAQPATPAGGTNANSKYSCITKSPWYIDGGDSQSLSSAFLSSTPLQIQKSSKTSLNGETVTKDVIIPSGPKVVNSFIDKISALHVMQNINNCSQQVTNANALQKGRDAAQANNIKITLYVDASKVVKRVEIIVLNKKSSTTITANFGYDTPAKVAKPADAKSASDFYTSMLTDAYKQDPGKEQDLYNLNAAMEGYIRRTNTLPRTLADLGLTDLKRPISTYTYTYTSRTYNGGPTLSYSLCAVFNRIGTGQPYVGVRNNDPSIYTIHKYGTNCYANGYYRGDSHISSPY